MKPIIYTLLILFLFASCYEDKGNYDYNEVNKVAIALEEMYSYRLEKDTTVCIVPKLKQSLQANIQNLDFMWVHSTINEFIEGHSDNDTLSYTDTLRFHIDPTEKGLKYKHYFRLNVFDHLTGINYPVNTVIKLVKPYDGAWMVLHNDNGHAALGAIEYMGNSISKNLDAYYKETGIHLQGKGLCLGSFYSYFYPYGRGKMFNLFTVVTDRPEESGVFCQWEKFQQMRSINEMIYAPDQVAFNFSDVELIDGEASYGAVCLSDGVLFQSPIAMKLYKANINSSLKNVRIKYATKVAFSSLLYDEAGHRFCFYHNTVRDNDYTGDPTWFKAATENGSQYAINPIPVRDNNVEHIDPNALSAKQQVLYVGAGYHFDPGATRGYYAYGLSVQGQDSCFVYEFNMDGMVSTGEGYPAFSNYYRLKRPEGLDENSCFASTLGYSGILFYTSGNTVYRLDFKQSGGKATPVYKHSGGQATIMKFAKKSEVKSGMDYSAYEFDPNYSLGVAFDMGNGKFDFVVLNLSMMGGIASDSENYPATQVHTDFGEIKDFLFL